MIQWYNKRPLTPSQLEKWYEKLQHIPGGVFPLVLDQITNTARFMPTPAEVASAYGLFKVDNPEMFRSEQDREACYSCDGRGYIEAYERPKDLKSFLVGDLEVENWNRIELPCALCENWKLSFPTKGDMRPQHLWTKEQALAKGLRFDDPYQLKGKKPKKEPENINELVNQVAEQLSFSLE